jgi:hypothetical protein
VVGVGRGVDGNEQPVRARLINQSPFTLPSSCHDPQIIPAQQRRAQDYPRNSSAPLWVPLDLLQIIWLMTNNSVTTLMTNDNDIRSHAAMESGLMQQWNPALSRPYVIRELLAGTADCFCQGQLSSHLQTSAVTDVRTPPHRLLTWHGSRLKGTKGLLEGSGVRVRVRWNQEGLQTFYQGR